MKPCPKCGCADELTVDSSAIAEASWIECGMCDFRFQRACDEETLKEKWDALSRLSMPLFMLPVEMLPREVPAQEISLRRCLDYWYGRAKAAEAKLSQQSIAV